MKDRAAHWPAEGVELLQVRGKVRLHSAVIEVEAPGLEPKW